MQIEFARGDSYDRGFVIKYKTSGQTVTENWDEIYLTVKKYHTDQDYKFQKRLTTGGIVDDGNGHYTFFIEPNDTDELSFGDYEFDIEVIKGEYKHTFYGKIKLTKEVTYVSNE